MDPLHLRPADRWCLFCRLVAGVHPLFPSYHAKGTASLIMLTAWSIWKHRNAAVFDNATPNFASLLDLIKTDARCWASAGPAGLGMLLLAVSS